MPAGSYQLALRLADPEPRLRELPRYAIAFANVDMFDEETGLNQAGLDRICIERDRSNLHG